ncbi:hypothetical protein F4779DRAFT_483017 [Xylariaceae sp. FL0662B]|nr:hypothetical protein F4779DRAFT_483017 [Xylariaceae sp. FL0662B]
MSQGSPQIGGRSSDSHNKRKRTSAEPSIPNKRARLDAVLNLTSSDDVKALELVESKYDVQIHSILSSSRIQKKVSSILRHLGPSSSAAKTRVSILHARAADAGKLVSIAEIAKREIAKTNDDRPHWFQHIALGEALKERPRDDGKSVVEETKLGGGRGPNDDQGDSDFEVMKTPFERAIEGQPLLRGVPVMSLFLSRVPIEELKKPYGEQTNAPPIQKAR